MGTTYWGHELDLARSHDIDRMTTQLLFPIVSTGTKPLYSTVFEIFASKYIGEMPLTFQGT